MLVSTALRRVVLLHEFTPHHTGARIHFDEQQVHTVAALFKQRLRDMPVATIPKNNFYGFIAAEGFCFRPLGICRHLYNSAV